MEVCSWNLSRGDASRLLGNLAQRIRKKGGQRQRSEGLKLIVRIQVRLREWVE